jgi:hypothetical protein
MSAVDSGRGLRKRCIERLTSRISSDPKLFRIISQWFLADIESLIVEAEINLRDLADSCCDDIWRDLQLLQGHEVEVEDNGEIRAISEILAIVKERLDRAKREFETISLGGRTEGY